MPSYTIEARSFKILGVAGHDFWVLRDEQGTALAELHGLATDRETGTALLVGTDETKHSLRAWHFPHDAAYAASVGVKVTSTSYIDDSQQSNTIAIGDKDEILARWNTAVKAMPELNVLDLNYPDYGFKVFGDTVNSNSAFRTFGELMSLPVEDFPGSIEPGLGNRMLSEERIEELRYREQPDQNREPERNPANDPTHQGHPDHALMQQIRKKIEGLNGSGYLQAADTDRISASVYALAKQNNFSSVDEIALSKQTNAAAAGEKIFILQGASDNPAALRAYMPTQEAIQTPVEQSFEKVRKLQSSESVTERVQQQPPHQIPEQEARQRPSVPSL
ncbi:XVIPCD domain-containing protein [Xanthomonas hortorum]|uniref:XVIPCD domain-containing protein n=1 Tax=Xanthomonas hortorum TaxID=56454 RepID=UPI002936CB73|nr:XVIPCD domain-containing protein [Xanthomonas hortorum]MDV2449513.1 DUF6696 domain-containing protein [Xanthomonas hortorum NBC5720]